ARKNKNHIIVYFEDLINDPTTEISKIFETLQLDLSQVNFELVQQNGLPYRVESSDVIEKSGSHTTGRPFQGFERSKIHTPTKNVPDDVVQKYVKFGKKKIYKKFYDY
ncbi:hypothetical protein, partial [Roseibium sp. MMSF_3544]